MSHVIQGYTYSLISMWTTLIRFTLVPILNYINNIITVWLWSRKS